MNWQRIVLLSSLRTRVGELIVRHPRTLCVICDVAHLAIVFCRSHQNAVVRAATARLLSDITDRIGPDHVMILPRDVKGKLLNTGAKLLMDGNLDAR